MSYIFKQKLNISDLAPVDSVVPKVLVFEPEDYLGGLYKHHLNNHSFDVRHCVSHHEIDGWINFFSPDLLIFSLDSDFSLSDAKKIFKKIPHIKIITTSFNISHENVKDLMASGVLGHINRRFSRPKDLVTLAKTLFYH